MVHTHKKTAAPEMVCVTLNDLIKINNARIEYYNQAIHHATALNTDFCHLFNEIITECRGFNENLFTKISKLDSHPKIGGYASGIIYQAWLDLKVAFKSNTQDALLNSCQYNEEVTQLAYKAALNVSAKINDDCFTLIEQQQAALTCILASLKKCHGVRPYSRPVQNYFN
jgi:uncharacterized protein (TIGR02284 family)